MPARQWLLLAEVLGLEPLEEPAPVSARTTATPRRSRAEMWAANLTAARQYAHREGHLIVPRPHIETVDGTDHALGIFIANFRARRTNLAPERVAELTTIGMRWS
ncbi:helicase associated domain-containing protein [Streptomyces sp. NBC_01800]|uniref:helicase associated domain-containing protein n=1 Tax=Streptomyces sp. NBC_01800 TaxID=2975945 RepID=UPI002DD8C6C9|nr:helicase associated domain-containing protein [Streptomyces sp. NBC_01800]WSA65641.1 helicase associated domain-containing protein [Streptomyces sp. NBC_01800]WSA73476.1 helicase associated domain-containing protein [Streptomyces sp. NBC_01800]